MDYRRILKLTVAEWARQSSSYLYGQDIPGLTPEEMAQFDLIVGEVDAEAEK